MKKLYTSAPVRETLGSRLNPGGMELTERILELTGAGSRDFILDVGCGAGATLALLYSRGFTRTVGLDLDSTLLSECTRNVQGLIQADAARIPLVSSCCDLIMSECVYNLTDKKQMLAECGRLLRPGGLLAITDIYARAAPVPGPNWPVHCCFVTATDLATLEKEVMEAGFSISLLEDHTLQLKQAAAEFVFAYGSLHGFWRAVTGDERMASAACDASATVRPGLYLLIAERLKNNRMEL
jgi:arsenite methyltransferase